MNATPVVVFLCKKCVKVRVIAEGKVCDTCTKLITERNQFSRDIRMAKYLLLAFVLLCFAVLGVLIYLVTNI